MNEIKIEKERIRECNRCFPFSNKLSSWPVYKIENFKSQKIVILLGEAPAFPFELRKEKSQAKIDRWSDKGLGSFGRTAGKVLFELLKRYPFENYYISNLIKCISSQSDQGSFDNCKNLLNEELLNLELEFPEMIFAIMGRKSQGLWTAFLVSFPSWKENVSFYVFHPMAAIYNPEKWKILDIQFRKIYDFLEKSKEQKKLGDILKWS